MEIEVLAKFTKEEPLSAEELEDNYVDSIINNALKPTATHKTVIVYKPVVMDHIDIKGFEKMDENHTTILLKHHVTYDVRIPYDQWLPIYQQLTGRNIMRIKFAEPISGEIRKKKPARKISNVKE